MDPVRPRGGGGCLLAASAPSPPASAQRPPPPARSRGGARLHRARLTSQSSSYLTLSVIFHNMASCVPQNSRQLNPGSPHPPSGKSKIGVTVAERLPPPPPPRASQDGSLDAHRRLRSAEVAAAGDQACQGPGKPRPRRVPAIAGGPERLNEKDIIIAPPRGPAPRPGLRAGRPPASPSLAPPRTPARSRRRPEVRGPERSAGASRSLSPAEPGPPSCLPSHRAHA